MGSLEERSLLGRRRSSWVDNIKTNLRETGLGGMDWINLIQDRNRWMALVNTIRNLRVSQNVGRFLSSWTTGGFLRRA
jgi:hypothetical protein